MSDKAIPVDPSEFKAALESNDAPAIDPARQFRVVAIVAMLVAGPFIIGHMLVGLYAFPAFAELFAGMPGQLPVLSAAMLSLGWAAGPMFVIIDVATFWLLYRLAQRWWIGLLFVPVFIYMMMSAFVGFLLYMPLFPLVTLVK
jgi:hypothetical protein